MLARKLYCQTTVGGCVEANALQDTSSEISLMCPALFEQVSRAMLSLGKLFQVETCGANITSYTQNQTCIMSRVWLDITFRDLTLDHPIYICTLETELLLIGQNLLD